MGPLYGPIHQFDADQFTWKDALREIYKIKARELYKDIENEIE